MDIGERTKRGTYQEIKRSLENTEKFNGVEAISPAKNVQGVISKGL